MILPPLPAAIMRPAMIWLVNSRPRTLMSNWRSKSASVISASGAMLNIAGAVDQDVDSAHVGRRRRRAISSIDSRRLTSTATATAVAPISRAVCCASSMQQVGDDDARAFLDIALGDGAADAAGAAGDDGDLVLQPHRSLLPRTALTANFDRA